MYIYERPEWPMFTWDGAYLSKSLGEARAWQGGLIASMNSLYHGARQEASTMVHIEDVMRTSEIEGLMLDVDSVRSSIAKRASIVFGGKGERVDRDVDGIVDLVLDASGNYEDPLSASRLFSWHRGLFPQETKMKVGAWRNEESGPMEVVSGRFGKEVVHFEAPGFDRVGPEMKAFLDWFEQDDPTMDGVIKSAIAHFWFVTIHPFEDGNGRIARAIGDMSLARVEKTINRYYSMSAEIQHRREEYYDVLERSQKGATDITEWIEWYLICVLSAIQRSGELVDHVWQKAKFWERNRRLKEWLNERQELMIDRLLDGFDGKLTSSKWARICKCSQDTANRDISQLVRRKVFVKSEARGRSTSYTLIRE